MKFIHAITFLLHVLFFLPAVAPAFDDDSTDDSRSLLEIRTICENGRSVIDTDINHASCRGDDVYLNQLRTALLKNGVEIIREDILDFKVSRNGNLYYRTKIGPYLYNEQGQMNSNGGIVVLFLVSSSGDVVYLNDRGDVFKNGTKLYGGAAKVSALFSDIEFLGKRVTLIDNPLVARNGKAIYINDDGHLYVDGDRISPNVSHIVAIKLNSDGDVYYIDDNNRIYRNKTKIFDGKFKILEFQITNKGQVAYFTNAISRNMFLDSQVLPSGSQQVVRFSFNSLGEIIYEDKLGRLWKNGQRIGP